MSPEDPRALAEEMEARLAKAVSPEECRALVGELLDRGSRLPGIPEWFKALAALRAATDAAASRRTLMLELAVRLRAIRDLALMGVVLQSYADDRRN